MKKFEIFYVNHIKSFICFLFAIISFICVIGFYYDYKNINDITNKDLKEISYIEGVVEEINTPKTNMVIIVDESYI